MTRGIGDFVTVPDVSEARFKQKYGKAIWVWITLL